MTDDDTSDVASTMAGMSISEPRTPYPGSLNGVRPASRGGGPPQSAPTRHLQSVPFVPAPHWLLPEEERLTSLGSATTSVAGISTAGGSTATSVGGPPVRPVSYNAWGPNGEYARMVKTPTVASGSTRTTETTQRQPAEEGRKGWAKVVSNYNSWLQKNDQIVC